jgi:hypothetical protein
MPRSGWAILLVALGGWACGSTPGTPTGSSSSSSSTTTSSPTTSTPTTSTTTTSTSGATGFTVSGTVTDGTSGGILPNIVVSITDGANSGKSATTGSAGTYAIRLVTPGTMTLSASAIGYVTATKSVVVSADTRVDWVLTRVPSSTTTTSIATTSASYAGGNNLDLSLFFTVPAGGLVAFVKPSRVHAEATYNVSGSFTAGPNRLTGTISGTLLNGTPANGSFDGTVFLNLTGCTASRRYSGTVTSAALNWSNLGDVTLCPNGAPWPFNGIAATAK